MRHLRKFNENSKCIIEDILNEGFSDIFNKLKGYARKGLLTAAIVVSVALSSQAQQQDKIEIIKTGSELLKNDEQQLLYSFMIGISSEYASKFMTNGDIDNSGALIEISKYYEDLRDGKQSLKLSKIANDRAKSLLQKFVNLNDDDIIKYMVKGKKIRH